MNPDNPNFRETHDQRNRRQMHEARQAAGAHLDKELRHIENMIDPLPSFARGVQFGSLVIGGLNTMAPGMFGVAEWPLPIRMVVGLLCVTLAAHFLLRQRGFMIAQKINRSVSP